MYLIDLNRPNIWLCGYAWSYAPVIVDSDSASQHLSIAPCSPSTPPCHIHPAPCGTMGAPWHGRGMRATAKGRGCLMALSLSIQ